MRKLVYVIVAACGVSLTVGGLLAFLFGLVKDEVLIVSDLGPFNGIWDPQDYCFFGAILATLGSACVAFGLLGRRV